MKFYTEGAFDFNLTVIFHTRPSQRVYCTAIVLECSPRTNIAESVDSKYVVTVDSRTRRFCRL